MNKHPTLDQLITEGAVVIDGQDYVGIASDGTEVSLGSVGYEEGAERYLSANPSPEQW